MTANLPIIDSILAGDMIIIGIVILLYFLPTVVAIIRGHNNSFIMFLINLFAGWTGIIWIILLVWAGIGEKKENNNA